MARYRALGEEARRTSVVGHIAATNLPEFEVLDEWVLSIFPEAVRECSPSKLSNGWFEVKFTSSDAKDEALAGSPYDLAGAHCLRGGRIRIETENCTESLELGKFC